VLLLCLSLVALSPQVEILETGPLGSELDRPPIRNALDAFPGMFASAESTLDIAQMYMLYYPAESRGRALYLLYDGIIAAAQRGVRVRILLDSTVQEQNQGATYRRMRQQLARVPGIEVRVCDLRPHSRYEGCMMHAKYLVVDRKLTVVGSHNWSFGAFTDNIELSLAVEDTELAAGLERVFETDWAAAEGRRQKSECRTRNEGVGVARLVVTSPERLRDSSDLSTVEALKRVFGVARRSVDIAVNSLTTRVDFGPGTRYGFVDSLVRDADRRGVHVRLLVDKWAEEHEATLFSSLDSLGNVEVKVINIEPAGPNPQRGTMHAKLVIADGAAILLGSATFSQRQLEECRNVGVLLRDPDVARALTDLFERSFFSVYARRP
jgi:phosphatidylserine/phosphatidylglycerophosphate/cardiolipin synthase-like enzyme